MSSIRIVTDSTSDIPAEVREALGIEMVPLKVHFGTETYLDSVTITPEEFYRKLAEADNLPTTSQPSPMNFLETYKRLAAEPGTQIISIHLSSAFSGTYQSAVLAKSLMEDDTDLTIIDSKTATYGIGLLAVAAAEAAREGRSKEEILELIDKLRNETLLLFMVDTLENLHKGGRIGKAASVLGSLLNIKPILSIDDDGEVVSVDKARGVKRAKQRIVEMLKEQFPGPIKATVAHTASPETAEEWSALLRDNFQVTALNFTNIGPVIGTHVGGGTVGVFVVPAE